MKQSKSWPLPPVFEPKKAVDGVWTRQNGEPGFMMLTSHANDKTLTCSKTSECCDCGLVHVQVYNLLRSPNGEWYLIDRVYRVDGTGPNRENPKKKRKKR